MCVGCSNEEEIIEEKKVETPKITHVSNKYSTESEEDVEEETIIETKEEENKKDEEETVIETNEEKDEISIPNEQVHTYVLNTDSLLFHTPLCWHVNRMSEKNKKIVEDTRDAIIAKGYTPCEHCEP